MSDIGLTRRSEEEANLKPYSPEIEAQYTVHVSIACEMALGMTDPGDLVKQAINHLYPRDILRQEIIKVLCHVFYFRNKAKTSTSLEELQQTIHEILTRYEIALCVLSDYEVRRITADEIDERAFVIRERMVTDI